MSIKKILFFGFFIFTAFFVNDKIHSINNLWQKYSLIENAKQELDAEKKKNAELKSKLALVEDESFIEAQARNKLLLVKSGEGIVVLPSRAYVSPERINSESKKDTRSNLQKWRDLFF